MRGVDENVGLSCEVVDGIHDRPEVVVREAGALQDYDVWIEDSNFVQDKLCTAQLQTPHIGQGSHLSVQRQDFQASTGVLVSDEAVKQAGALGGLKG